MTTPADLNGLVRFAERRNLVSARVPSHFKRSLLPDKVWLWGMFWLQTCSWSAVPPINHRSDLLSWEKEELSAFLNLFNFVFWTWKIHGVFEFYIWKCNFTSGNRFIKRRWKGVARPSLTTTRPFRVFRTDPAFRCPQQTIYLVSLLTSLTARSRALRNLNIYGPVVSNVAPDVIVKNSTFHSTQNIYVLCTDLRTNSDYFPIQH